MRTKILLLFFIVFWGAFLAGCDEPSATPPKNTSTPTPFPYTLPTAIPTATRAPIPTERPIHYYLANSTLTPGYLYRSMLQNLVELDFGPDGLLYIADWLGRQIIRVAPDGSLEALKTWRDPNLLGDALRCIEFSPDGRLYSCDHWHIYRFNEDLTIERSLPLPDGTFVASIVFGPEGDLYYSDRNAGVVMRINQNGIAEQVASGIQNAEYMVFGLDGTLYVSQMNLSRIVKVDVKTGLVEEFYSGGLGFDQIFLTLDPEGNIWTLGTGSLNMISPQGVIQSFTIEGHFELAPSAGITFDDQGNLWLGSFQDWLWKLERTNSGETVPDFKPNLVFSGLFVTSMATDSENALYAVDQHSKSLIRFNENGDYEIFLTELGNGNHAIAINENGNIFLGLASNQIVRLEEDGSITNFATLLTRSMVFGEEGALYAIVGNYGEEKSLVRITGIQEYEVLAKSIAGIPLGNGESQIKAAPGGFYIISEGVCNLFFIDYEGQGRLITNKIPNSGGCSPVAMASTSDGDIFFISHNPYILQRISPQGVFEEYAYNIVGDPWAMVVSQDGKWLYVAEAGAIDKVPISPQNE